MNQEDPLSTGEHLETIRGVKLWYLVRGTGPVVLLQPGGAGWGGDATPYIETFKPLEETRTVVYLEPRGIGRSERLDKDGCYSIDEYAEDIESLRKHLNVPRIGVIGHSHGGFVALKYAVKYPDNVNSLVLMGTSPSLEQAKKNREWIMKRIERRKIIAFILKSFLRSDEEKLRLQLKSALPLINFYDFEKVANQFNALLDNMIISPEPLSYFQKHDRTFNVVDQLGTITAPVLVIRGELEYPGNIAAATVLQESIREARLTIFEKCGHWPMIEAPESLFKEIKAFYSEINEK